MTDEISEVNNIITNIMTNDNINSYEEFRLKKHISITEPRVRSIINNLDSYKNVKTFFNKKSYSFDSIGVIDIKGERIIDFNDDYLDMMDKGLDFMASTKKI